MGRRPADCENALPVGERLLGGIASAHHENAGRASRPYVRIQAVDRGPVVRPADRRRRRERGEAPCRMTDPRETRSAGLSPAAACLRTGTAAEPSPPARPSPLQRFLLLFHPPLLRGRQDHRPWPGSGWFPPHPYRPPHLSRPCPLPNRRDGSLRPVRWNRAPDQPPAVRLGPPKECPLPPRHRRTWHGRLQPADGGSFNAVPEALRRGWPSRVLGLSPPGSSV